MPARMTSLTKAAKYDTVVFKDTNGVQHSGVALEFRSTYMLVGVNNPEKRMVTVQTRGKDGTPKLTKVPNNSVWSVPYDSVTHTAMSADSVR